MTTCLAHTSNTVIFIVRHICWKLYCISLKALHLWPHVPDFQQCVMGCLECNHIKQKQTWSVPCGLGILILQNTLCSLVWTVLFCLCVSLCDYLASMFTCLSVNIYTQALLYSICSHAGRVCVSVFDASQWRQSFSFALKLHLFWKVCVCVFAAPVTFTECVAVWGKPFVMFSFR